MRRAQAKTRATLNGGITLLCTGSWTCVFYSGLPGITWDYLGYWGLLGITGEYCHHILVYCHYHRISFSHLSENNLSTVPGILSQGPIYNLARLKSATIFINIIATFQIIIITMFKIIFTVSWDIIFFIIIVQTYCNASYILMTSAPLDGWGEKSNSTTIGGKVEVLHFHNLFSVLTFQELSGALYVTPKPLLGFPRPRPQCHNSRS